MKVKCLRNNKVMRISNLHNNIEIILNVFKSFYLTNAIIYNFSIAKWLVFTRVLQKAVTVTIFIFTIES